MEDLELVPLCSALMNVEQTLVVEDTPRGTEWRIEQRAGE